MRKLGIEENALDLRVRRSDSPGCEGFTILSGENGRPCTVVLSTLGVPTFEGSRELDVLASDSIGAYSFANLGLPGGMLRSILMDIVLVGVTYC